MKSTGILRDFFVRDCQNILPVLHYILLVDERKNKTHFIHPSTKGNQTESLLCNDENNKSRVFLF